MGIEEYIGKKALYLSCIGLSAFLYYAEAPRDVKGQIIPQHQKVVEAADNTVEAEYSSLKEKIIKYIKKELESEGEIDCILHNEPSAFGLDVYVGITNEHGIIVKVGTDKEKISFEYSFEYPHLSFGDRQAGDKKMDLDVDWVIVHSTPYEGKLKEFDSKYDSFEKKSIFMLEILKKFLNL